MASIDRIENQRIAQAIRTVRRSQGLRQKECAVRCGFTQSRMSKIESGQQWIRAVDVRRLAAVLQVSLEELLGLGSLPDEGPSPAPTRES